MVGLMDLFAKLRAMCLLLIDDDEWVRESLKLYFESEGCRIIALETAEEGLYVTAMQHFDIIIVDYRLPGMDGLEFIKHLPANQTDTLKILMTAYGSRDLIVKAKNTGFHDFIHKPFTMEVLEKSLNRVIVM
jgi:DNA-binding NtrC family response regulator